MKKFFSFKINNKLIDQKSQLIQKEAKSLKLREKIKKYFIYFCGFSFVSLYVHYLMKASGLMKSLEIDKKYLSRQKKIEEKYNVDLKLNDEKLKEFEEKWGINKAIIDYENKIKYGNKELNKKEDVVLDGANYNSSSDSESDIKDTQLVKVEVSQLKDNKIEVVKGKEFEQLKYIQGGKENLDPTVMGNTIIFDSRLDRVDKVIVKK